MMIKLPTVGKLEARQRLARRAAGLRCAAVLLVLLGGCRDRRAPAADRASTRERAAGRETAAGIVRPSPAPLDSRPAPVGDSPRRQPGAARAEAPPQIAAARVEVERLTRALLEGGVSAREVTSIADIRGFRLFRRRRFRAAQVWFEAGMRVDPSFEPCVFNAARAAAALGQHKASRSHLNRLRRLGTPLAQRLLGQAAADLDLRNLK